VGLSRSQPILHQVEALFGGWLLRRGLSPRVEGAFSRQRDWPLRLSFWTFLEQENPPLQALSPSCAQRTSAGLLVSLRAASALSSENIGNDVYAIQK